MPLLIALFQRLLDDRSTNTDEAFLAESVDLQDLERRMRLLDGRRTDFVAHYPIVSYG